MYFSIIQKLSKFQLIRSLDYLDLEFSQNNFEHLFAVEKGTQTDSIVEIMDSHGVTVGTTVNGIDKSDYDNTTVSDNEIKTVENYENKIENNDESKIASESENVNGDQIIVSTKVPPTRPPPPKVMVSISLDTPDAQIVSSSKPTKSPPLNNSKINGHKSKTETIKKKFSTIKSNTTGFTKKVYKQFSKKAPFKSYTLGDSRKKLYRENKVDQTDAVEGEEIVACAVSSEVCSSPPTITQLERSKSLNSTRRSRPLKTYQSFSNDQSLDELMEPGQQILNSYPIMSRLVQFHTVSNEEDDEERNCEPLSEEQESFLEDCQSAFISTCRRQIRDEVLRANSSLGHSMDLDSIGLMPLQQGPYKVYWIPGWKHMRIAEDLNTHQRFIILKNSYCKTWVFLSRQKLKYEKRWICFPLESINTLKNEIELTEKGSLYWNILQLILLMAVSKFYENANSPDNIDPNNILLIASRYGIIVTFHECLNESRLLTLDFIPCDSVAEIPEQLELAKTSVYNQIDAFFKSPKQTPDNLIKLLIASTWPLDYLLLVLVELIEDYNYREQINSPINGQISSSNSSSVTNEEPESKVSIVISAPED